MNITPPILTEESDLVRKRSAELKLESEKSSPRLLEGTTQLEVDGVLRGTEYDTPSESLVAPWTD